MYAFSISLLLDIIGKKFGEKIILQKMITSLNTKSTNSTSLTVGKDHEKSMNDQGK